MLPYPDYLPPNPSEISCNAPIAPLVLFQFIHPEMTVGIRNGGVLRTSMPEAPVHENCNTNGRKRKVRGSFYGPMPSPSLQRMAPEERGQRKFGLFVTSPPDSGHHIRTLLFAEHICHGLSHHEVKKANPGITRKSNQHGSIQEPIPPLAGGFWQ